MKTKKQIKERIRLIELDRVTGCYSLDAEIDLKIQELSWVLDEQDGPVEFGEMTS